MRGKNNESRFAADVAQQHGPSPGEGPGRPPVSTQTAGRAAGLEKSTAYDGVFKNCLANKYQDTF